MRLWRPLVAILLLCGFACAVAGAASTSGPTTSIGALDGDPSLDDLEAIPVVPVVLAPPITTVRPIAAPTGPSPTPSHRHDLLADAPKTSPPRT